MQIAPYDEKYYDYYNLFWYHYYNDSVYRYYLKCIHFVEYPITTTSFANKTTPKKITGLCGCLPLTHFSKEDENPIAFITQKDLQQSSALKKSFKEILT
jgi:hypothetical protein